MFYRGHNFWPAYDVFVMLHLLCHPYVFYNLAIGIYSSSPLETTIQRTATVPSVIFTPIVPGVNLPLSDLPLDVCFVNEFSDPRNRPCCFGVRAQCKDDRSWFAFGRGIRHIVVLTTAG